MPVKGIDKDIEPIDSLIGNFKTLPNEKKIFLISNFIDELKRIGSEFENSSEKDKSTKIPIGIFDNNVLGSLEAIVKYLKEAEKINFSKIAKLLNRSNKTIWATYQKAHKKLPSPFEGLSTKILVPASIFSNREFSILESLVGFIKDLGYSNHEVGVMLRLDDRTIWTVYDRTKRKRGMKS